MVDSVPSRRYGPPDVIGITAVIVSLVFAWVSTVGTIVGIGLLVVAAIMLVTAAVGYCPLYRVFNISTDPTLHRTSKLETKATTSTNASQNTR